MPVCLDSWKSRYEHIKENTVQIKRYLVRESTQSVGAREWQLRLRKDPNNIDYDDVYAVSVQNMVEMASILAEDPVRGALVSNAFLNRLAEAIELRRYQGRISAQRLRRAMVQRRI
jgi:hypothetical protein